MRETVSEWMRLCYNLMIKTEIVGIVIITANVICETIMGFMNTPDIIDAVYGIAGTIISFCFLAVSRRYGLKIISELI